MTIRHGIAIRYQIAIDERDSIVARNAIGNLHAVGEASIFNTPKAVVEVNAVDGRSAAGEASATVVAVDLAGTARRRTTNGAVLRVDAGGILDGGLAEGLAAML